MAFEAAPIIAWEIYSLADFYNPVIWGVVHVVLEFTTQLEHALQDLVIAPHLRAALRVIPTLGITLWNLLFPARRAVIGAVGIRLSTGFIVTAACATSDFWVDSHSRVVYQKGAIQ